MFLVIWLACAGDPASLQGEAGAARAELTDPAPIEVARFHGEHGSRAGETLTAGDFDGDGDADLVVGIPSDYPGAYGGAVLLDGPLGGDYRTADARAHVLLPGATALVAEDLDRDGRDDLLAASPRGIVGYTGPIAGRLDGFAAPIWIDPGGCAPTDLVRAGDTNGDGSPDLLVRCASEEQAWAHLIGQIPSKRSVVDALVTATLPEGTQPAGDLDGDGLADLLFVEEERVVIVSGAERGTIDSSVAFATVPGELDHAGRGGDLNGDGYDDLLVGQTFWEGLPEGSRTYVLHGPLRGEHLAHDAGVSLQSSDHRVVLARPAGDLDGDGHADLIGADDSWPHSDDADNLIEARLGLAWVAFGPFQHGTETVGWIAGPDITSRLGTLLVGHDLDADGRADVALGNTQVENDDDGLVRLFVHGW